MSQPDSAFATAGEMAERFRSFDWSTTPFGALDAWPVSLRTTAAMMLENRFPMSLWWGRDLRLLYNDAYIPVLGGKHPDALARPAREVWAEIWSILGPQTEQVLQGHGATWNEHLLLPMKRKGFLEETYFTFSYSPVRDEAGAVAGVLVTCQETTVEVQDARRLRMLRDLGARTAEATSAEDACRAAAAVLAENDADLPFALLYLVDDGGESASLVAAAGMAGCAGKAAPEVVTLRGPHTGDGWPLAEAHATGRPVVVSELSRRFGPLPGGRWQVAPEQAVVLSLGAGGQSHPHGFLVAGVSPLRPLDESYVGLYRLTADQLVIALSGARAFEEQRKRAEALAELDRAKTAFFQNVSHELRTPLTLMVGPAEDALADTAEPLSPAQRERMELVRRNGLRLQKLVNTLLDFARIEAGRAQASFLAADLAALTRDLAGTFRSLVESAGLSFVVDCPGLPEAVYVDPSMWEKIVLNLLSNAFKFTFDGEIRVTLGAAGDRAELRVEDTGTGIPPHELPHIFDRFHRVEGARGRSHEGTGIGLALVRELVRLHGGTVGVTSTLGAGTTFTVTLPMGSAHLPAGRSAAPGRMLAPTGVGAEAFLAEASQWKGARVRSDVRPAVPRSPGGGAEEPAAARILVADDNADLRSYLARLLSQRWTVETASDGAEALAAAQASPPDLVLSDVMMPVMDGLQLVRELRADPRTRAVPIMLLSARAGEEATVEGLKHGADDYLIKPFSAKELEARIETQLELARSRREGRRPMSPLIDPWSVFDGAGEAGALMRAHDWGSTPLGPVTAWPQSLLTSLSICLRSKFPTVIYWGPKVATLYNDGYAPILGAKHPGAIGRPITEVWAEIWDDIRDMVDGVVSTGVATWSEDKLLYMRRSGYLEECYFTWSFAPITVESGEIGGLYCAVVETTARVLGERRLQTLQELGRVAAGARSVSDAFRACCDVVGAHPADVPFALAYLVDENGKEARLACASGLHRGDPMSPESVELDDDEAVWPFCRVVRTGTAELVEGLSVRVLHPTVQDPVGSALVLPLLRSGHDRPQGLLVLGISPRRRLDDDYRAFFHLAAEHVAAAVVAASAYEEGQERARALAELDRAKTAFFGNVSHELRTPLTLILGPVEDALASASRTLGAGGLDLVRRNAMRLYKMVGNLLDFARMEAGRAQATFVPTDLAAFTADLASNFRSTVESAGLRLVVDCPPLPETIYVDPEMWEKIVLNLLSNAVKYTHRGAIRVSLRWEDDQAVLSVQDTGVGIPQEELSRVFERFYRVRVTEGRSHEGTGIGLALVRELVQLHGGTVSAASTLGRGSTFTVRVPRGSEHLPGERLDRTPRPRSTASGAPLFVEEARRWTIAGAPDLQLEIGEDTPAEAPAERLPARVLVVDDNADLRSYVAGILERHFRDVEAAGDGRAALDAARARRPDVIVADVMMPALDGFALVRALRAEEGTRAVPILLLSARAGEESAVEGLKSGADDYLVKPFSARELVARVRAQLEMAGVRRAAARVELEKEELRDTVQARDEFLTVASHELRTPLTALEIHLERLLRLLARGHTLAGDELAEKLQVALRQAQRLARLIDSLMDASRIALGRLALSVGEADLADLARKVVRSFEDDARAVRATLHLDAAPAPGSWDASRIEQVLGSLVSNAIRFAPGTRIDVSVRPTEGGARAVVHDMGTGIAAADAERIFRRFERAASPRHYGGLGIGLYLARHIVEAHGGTLRVESSPEHGTTFTVDLPVSSAAPHEPSPALPATSPEIG